MDDASFSMDMQIPPAPFLFTYAVSNNSFEDEQIGGPNEFGWGVGADENGNKVTLASVRPQPTGVWNTFATETVEMEGYIPADAVYLLTVVEMNISAGEYEIMVDNVRIGCTGHTDKPQAMRIKSISKYEKPISLDIPNGNFEQGNDFSGGQLVDDAFYNKKALSVKGEAHYDLVTASVKNISVGAYIKGDGSIALEHDGVQLTQKSVSSTNWTYVKTDSIPNNMEQIRIKLSGDAIFDLVQAGEPNSFNGNPKKMVLATYILVFGEEGNWRNWKYETDIPNVPSKNPDIIQSDGRREIAGVGYPMIGAYSNMFDEAVMEYHLDLADAMSGNGLPRF